MGDILFDRSIEHARKALDLSVTRQKLISSNLANRDTPGYRSKDLNFQEEMERLYSGSSVSLQRTDPGHLPVPSETATAEVVLKESEARLDGNTVNLSEEMSRLAENTYLYQSLIRMVGYKLQSLKRAIQGG
jgi:flagellar basal-body rod protein FlgB